LLLFLSSSLVEFVVSVHPGLERSVVGVILDTDAVGRQMERLAHAVVILPRPTGEAPFARNDQLLTTRELEFGSPERLDDMGLMRILATDADHGLSDVDTSDQTLGFAESSSHSSLEPISSGARQHFVDADDVEGVNADAHVERVLAHKFYHILVGANTSGFEGLGGELFILVGDHVDAERELIDSGPLPSQIVNTDLGIGDTPAKPRLGIRFVLAVPIAPRRPATHF